MEKLGAVAYPCCMRLDEKARENLPDDTGRDGLPNAASSRAYYAAYLAVADGALRAGLPFSDSSRTYFRHDLLADEAGRWSILDDDGCDVLRHLHGLRIKADYLEDQVDMEEASLAFDAATQLVNRLLPEAG
jgi:uncharacterized protein (UPF0332 family)